jgi:hypothetical protein
LKNLTSWSRQFTVSADRRFQFNERGQCFIRPNNETLSMAVMRIGNPDYSPLQSTASTQP